MWVPPGYRTLYEDVFQQGGGAVVSSTCEVWHVARNEQVAELDLVGGNVKTSRTDAITRSCDVTLPAEGLIPDLSKLTYWGTYGDGTYGDGPYGDLPSGGLRGLVLPAQHELRIHYRIYDDDMVLRGTIPMGRFRISRTRFKHTPDRIEARIVGFDVTREVALAGYNRGHQIPKGTNTGIALRDLLLGAGLPESRILIPTTDVPTPELTFLAVKGANRWEDARLLAATAGWELISTRENGIVAVPMAQPSTGTALWSINDGWLVSDENAQDDEGLINEMVVYGEASGENPVVGSFRINSGPWGVPSIGLRTDYEPSEFVYTELGARRMAEYLINRRNGLNDTNELVTRPLPFQDPVDLVDVTNGKLGLQAGTYVVEETDVDVAAIANSALVVSRRLV